MTTKTKSPTKKFTYLRVPLDDNFSNGLQLILNDNPFFSPVDALRFAMGKYIKHNYFGVNSSKVNINRLKFNNPQTNSQDITNFLQNNPDTKIEFDTFEDLDKIFKN
jgi:hypothetical protein